MVKWHGDIPIRNIGKKIHIKCGSFRFYQKEIHILMTGENKKEMNECRCQNLRLHLPYAFNVLCKVRSENI